MDREEFDQIYQELTDRQTRVLKLFCAKIKNIKNPIPEQQANDRDIAIELGVTDPSTVRRHISNICQAFNLKNEGGERFSYREELIDLSWQHHPEWFKNISQPPENLRKPPLPGDPLKWNSPFYLERASAESDCQNRILQPGALIRIKSPEKMGKTSLLNRAIAHAKANNIQPICLNLRQIETNSLQDLDLFLRSFCTMLNYKLRLDLSINDFWKSSTSSLMNCTIFMEEVLEEINRPLLLALEVVDRVFAYEQICQDFCSMLRGWHEEAKTLELWEALRLVVVHSTEPYGELDINRSPFNVGLPIELTEFTPHQVQDLAQGYGLNKEISEENLVDRLMTIVGGHPYLIQLGLYHLWKKTTTLEKLLEEASTDAGVYQDILRRHGETLQANSGLATAFYQVIAAREPVQLETMMAYQLYSMGLIKRMGDRVSPRCELYRQYFEKRLVNW